LIAIQPCFLALPAFCGNPGKSARLHAKHPVCYLIHLHQEAETRMAAEVGHVIISQIRAV